VETCLGDAAADRYGLSASGLNSSDNFLSARGAGGVVDDYLFGE
jgi:hypothetical protein